MIPIPDCTIKQADFRGWKGCHLSNGYVTLVAVPDIGGRIMAYDLGPYSYFFVDPELAGKLFSPEENIGAGKLADWKNYGGDKTWPSPQGWDNDEQWHGPPDPVLDTGRYTLDELSCDKTFAIVRMVSPPDERTGVKITRQFTLRQGSSRVKVDLSFENVVEKPIRWSIWDVVQLRAERKLPDGRIAHEPECSITTPLNAASRYRRGFNVMFGDEDNPQWQSDPDTGIFKAQYLWEIGKVGVDSTAGWIAFSNPVEGFAFAERFVYDPHGEYPDGGVSVECWTVGAGVVDTLNYEETEIYLMETEVLSTLRDIEPGMSSSFKIEWGVCHCPGPIVDVNGSGCIAEPLRANRKGDEIHLSGLFGVFDVGTLNIVWIGSEEEVLAVDQLRSVDPLVAVIIDEITSFPIGTRRVELRVQTEPDNQEQVLAGVEVK
jgi:hypothetical protein